MSRKAVAYVASTLPVAILDRKIAAWGISEILLQSRDHLPGYVYLQRRHPNLKLVALPESKSLNALHLFFKLLKYRLSGKRLFFFHECSCPVFDIYVKIIKPKGEYYPQVTLSSFLLVKRQDIPKSKKEWVLLFSGMSGWFDYYRGDMDNNEGNFFVKALKKYPSSIASHNISESRASIENQLQKNFPMAIPRKILILCGRDVVNDDHLREIYRKIIYFSNSLGLSCYVKDHPSKMARLNLSYEGCHMIDNAMPVELIENDFMAVIGVASTGLLNFSERAISIINILPFESDDVRSRRCAHLSSMDGSEKVQTPTNMSALESILTEMEKRKIIKISAQ